MISIENKLYNQTFSSTKKVQWNNQKLEDEDENKPFVTLRRSRKCTNLNDPVEFNKIPSEQSFIGRLLVLPSGGCCDTEYVSSRKNQSKKQLQTKKCAQHHTLIDSTPHAPSITINIGPSVPFHLNPILSAYHPITSHSTLSTNPKVMTKDQWETEERVILPQVPLQERATCSRMPLQKRVSPPIMPMQYCGSRTPCISIPSQEQRVINLDTSQKNVYDENLTYITKPGAPPKISPFKCCLRCFGCNRKEKEEVYVPSIIIKNKQPELLNNNEQPNRNTTIYPRYSRDTNFNGRAIHPDFSHMNIVPSRLSTITESEASYQQQSQESEPTNEKKV